MPYKFFDDPYVYGPITQEEFESLTVHHRMTYVNGQIYIGVVGKLEEFKDRIIQRPQQQEPVEDQTT